VKMKTYVSLWPRRHCLVASVSDLASHDYAAVCWRRSISSVEDRRKRTVRNKKNRALTVRLLQAAEEYQCGLKRRRHMKDMCSKGFSLKALGQASVTCSSLC